MPRGSDALKLLEDGHILSSRIRDHDIVIKLNRTSNHLQFMHTGSAPLPTEYVTQWADVSLDVNALYNHEWTIADNME